MGIARRAIRKLTRDTARGFARVHNLTIPLDDGLFSDVMRRAVIGGNYEEFEAAAVCRLFHPGDTVLELGAGIGFISACLRRQTQVGRIVAIEANPELVAYIHRMHAANAIDGVEVRNAAVVGEGNGSTAQFHIHRDFWASSLTPLDDATSISVPSVTWSALIEDIKPTAVVMDIEGGEREILACSFGSVKRMVLEIHPQQYGLAGMADCFAKLRDHGFELRNEISHSHVLALER